MQGRHDSAVERFRAWLKKHPGDARAHLDMAAPLFALGHLSEAEEAARAATALQDDLSQAWVSLATIQSARGQQGTPLKSILKATQLEPDNTTYRIRLGEVLLDQGHTDHAIKILEFVLRAEPENVNAIGGIAHALERKGEVEKAYEWLAPRIDTIEVHARVGTVWGIVCRRKSEHQRGIDVLLRMLQHDLKPQGRAMMLQELGALYDGLGLVDEAFGAYTEANTLRTGQWEPVRLTRWVDRMIATFTPEIFKSRPVAEDSPCVPIMIVGMPRSGTSLVEQILSSHPAVHAAGELEEVRAASLLLEARCEEPFPECMLNADADAIAQVGAWYTQRRREQANGTQAVTDKMPQNFQFLGFAAMSLPRVRIIHCVRKPLDTALSCYIQGFKSALCWSNRLEWLGPYIQQYQRMMKHWHAVLPVEIHEVHYEELVADPEPHIRAMAEYCGLSWHNSLLSHHRSSRTITTASYAQANQPIYTTSVGKSERYAAHLEPLSSFLEVE